MERSMKETRRPVNSRALGEGTGARAPAALGRARRSTVATRIGDVHGVVSPSSATVARASRQPARTITASAESSDESSGREISREGSGRDRR